MFQNRLCAYLFSSTQNTLEPLTFMAINIITFNKFHFSKNVNYLSFYLFKTITTRTSFNWIQFGKISKSLELVVQRVKNRDVIFSHAVFKIAFKDLFCSAKIDFVCLCLGLETIHSCSCCIMQTFLQLDYF